jgi:hypothetical protein
MWGLVPRIKKLDAGWNHVIDIPSNEYEVVVLSSCGKQTIDYWKFVILLGRCFSRQQSPTFRNRIIHGQYPIFEPSPNF